MNTKLHNFIIIRLILSVILLFLLHFIQTDYQVGESLDKLGISQTKTAFIILFVWLIFMAYEVVKYFKDEKKWFAISNITIIVSTVAGFFFVQILIVLASC